MLLFADGRPSGDPEGRRRHGHSQGAALPRLQPQHPSYHGRPSRALQLTPARTLSQLPVRSWGGGGGLAPPIDAIMASAASSAVIVLARSANGDGRGALGVLSVLGALGGGSFCDGGAGCWNTSCRRRTCAASVAL